MVATTNKTGSILVLSTVLLFNLATQICIGFYIYKQITSESDQKFLTKLGFHQFVDKEQNLDDGKHIRKKRDYSDEISIEIYQDYEEAHSAEVYQPTPVQLQKGRQISCGCNGDSGAKGERGDQGAAGIPGPSGIPGPPGTKGDRGLPGPQGLQGFTGPMGPKGDIGLPGPTGKTGLLGGNGHIGTPGPQGLKGDTGFPGATGLKGVAGIIGLPGPKGDAGLPGLIGPQGQCQMPFKVKIAKYGNEEYPQLPSRETDCTITHISDPESYGSTNNPTDSWMIDSDPPIEADGKKFWTTTDDNYTLYEYANKLSLVQNKPTKTYDLFMGFRDNAHVMYKGSLFYTSIQRLLITKFCLTNLLSEPVSVPGLTERNAQRLYRSNRNYFDFSIDENGLWVIFSLPSSNNTGVIKVDAEKMKIQYIWSTSLNHRMFEEMFIASGALYAIDLSGHISFGVDLYTGKLFNLELDTIEPFNATMATYDHNQKQLVVVNKGNRLLYPVQCEERNFRKQGVLAE